MTDVRRITGTWPARRAVRPVTVMPRVLIRSNVMNWTASVTVSRRTVVVAVMSVSLITGVIRGCSVSVSKVSFLMLFELFGFLYFNFSIFFQNVTATFPVPFPPSATKPPATASAWLAFLVPGATAAPEASPAPPHTAKPAVSALKTGTSSLAA